MAQGRGNVMGSQFIALGLAILLLLVHTFVVQATTYVVGDMKGWSFNVVSWPNGKHFRAGDVLIFKYNSSYHNVVVVSSEGYNNCSVSKGAKTYTSGYDRIELTKGMNYFICNFPGHCQAGIKIAVNAADLNMMNDRWLY